MTGLVIRLAGPLQSWGEHSGYAQRDTTRFPTRSGVIGMFAAAQGLTRDESLDRYDPLRLTVRIDRRGVMLRDFHTVGGGFKADRTVPRAQGGRRSSGATTIVSHRYYLADAVFAVGVDGPEPLIGAIAEALTHPHWQPYLGRRSCPPDQPLLLRREVEDAVKELEQAVPVAPYPEPRRQDTTQDELAVDIVREGKRTASTTELSDVPVSFERLDRRYRTRAVNIETLAVPDGLRHTRNYDYRLALYDYLELS